MTRKRRAKPVEALNKAVEGALSDERHAAQVARAVGAVQKGRAAVDRAQQRLMKAVGLPSKDDYRDVGKRIASLKRRLRQAAEKLEALG